MVVSEDHYKYEYYRNGNRITVAMKHDFIGLITEVKDCTKRDGEPFVLRVLADQKYTCPTRPISEHTCIQTTIDNLTKKTRSELLDKSFNLKASIRHVFFKDYWCQVTCPVCKDSIFKKDKTGVLSASITDYVAQKIIGKGPDKLFAENTHLGRRNLPALIKTRTSLAKQMIIRLLRTSLAATIRFLIVDIEDLQPIIQLTVPHTLTLAIESRLPVQNRKDSNRSTTSKH
ncbi:unnamed protein product [Lactuca saligna]|uniref:Uncharacterized protein n=1 Tax=Lactuca saligna TaxID=75948 RepID=A0AA36E057_LACSI|nr:unnamed protein product [Lactuca saligna]